MIIDAVELYSCPTICMITTQVNNHNGGLLHLACTWCIDKHDGTSLSYATMQPCNANKELWLVLNPHLSFIDYGHKVSQDALVRRLVINACTDAHGSCSGQVNRHAWHKTTLASNQAISACFVNKFE